MQIIETRQKHENGMNDICSTTWEIILFLLLEWKLLVITKSTKSVNIHMYSWMTAHIHRREHNLSRILNIIFYHNGNCSRWGKKQPLKNPFSYCYISPSRTHTSLTLHTWPQMILRFPGSISQLASQMEALVAHSATLPCRPVCSI